MEQVRQRNDQLTATVALLNDSSDQLDAWH
jgi:hypothetical protein